RSMDALFASERTALPATLETARVEVKPRPRRTFTSAVPIVRGTHPAFAALAVVVVGLAVAAAVSIDWRRGPAPTLLPVEPAPIAAPAAAPVSAAPVALPSAQTQSVPEAAPSAVTPGST